MRSTSNRAGENRLFVALMATLFLAGCASGERYPDHWAPLQAVQSGECPDLTGSYYVFDADIMQGIGFSKKTIYKSAVNYMKINQLSKNEYEFSAYCWSELVEKIIIKVDGRKCSCAAEGIGIAGGGRVLGENGIMVLKSGYYVLNKATDGSIVVKACDSELGACCVFPVPLGSMDCKYKRYFP